MIMNAKENNFQRIYANKRNFWQIFGWKTLILLIIERRLQQICSYNDKINDKAKAILINRLRLMKNQRLDVASTSRSLSRNELSVQLSQLSAC